MTTHGGPTTTGLSSPSSGARSPKSRCRSHPLPRLWRGTFLPPPAAGAPGVPGLVAASPQSLPLAIWLLLCFCLSCYNIRTHVTGFRATWVTQKGLPISALSYSHLQRPFFQIRPRSQVLRIRMWTYLLGPPLTHYSLSSGPQIHICLTCKVRSYHTNILPSPNPF